MKTFSTPYAAVVENRQRRTQSPPPYWRVHRVVFMPFVIGLRWPPMPDIHYDGETFERIIGPFEVTYKSVMPND